MSHPCRNYCSQWTGEQCKGCLISDEPDFAVGNLVVFDNKKPFMKRTQTTMFSFVRDWDENDAIVRAVGTEKTYEVNKLGIRLATLAEQAAGYRLDGVTDGTPTNEGTPCTKAEEIAVGSMVVFAGATFNENVGEVLKITSKSIVGNYPASAILNFPSGYPSFSTELSKLRLATPAEIELGQRIDAPTVCTEAEPLDLFNSKHCSPRNYSETKISRVGTTKRMTDLEIRLMQKNHSLKANNKHWKIAAGIAVVLGVVGWML